MKKKTNYHKFNFSSKKKKKKKKKDNSKVYRCTEYKTLNNYKSFINLKDNKEILKYENLHNYLEKEFKASISIAKGKIKEEIRKSSIPLGIKIEFIFKEVSQELEFIYIPNNMKYK